MNRHQATGSAGIGKACPQAHEYVIVCPTCRLDIPGYDIAAEAGYFADIHNGLHHTCRPDAFVVAVDEPEDVKPELSPNSAIPARSTGSQGVENDAYAAFCRRIVAAAGRRIAEGDIDGLSDLIGLHRDTDQAIRTAVAGLRRRGHSWSQIGSRLHISRQAAHQRWGGDQP
jgi:hypothetical protein